MSDDLCKCGHGMMEHREFGCEDCMCERFVWPVQSPDVTKQNHSMQPQRPNGTVSSVQRWREPCEVCGLYELGEHPDQVGDWCDGAGARPVTAKMLVAALIAEGGEIQVPMWDEFSQVSLPFSGSVNGRYLVFPIPVEEEIP